MRRARATTELVTVLFTDIVSSTQIAEEVGDRRWRALVAAHHGLARQALRRHHGRELDTAGDGFFAAFGKPADAIRCAVEVSEGVREFGLEIRAGLHVGEAEVMGDKVGGVAVNIAARIMSLGKAGGGPGVRHRLGRAAGKGIVFVDHGVHQLKGLGASSTCTTSRRSTASPVGCRSNRKRRAGVVSALRRTWPGAGRGGSSPRRRSCSWLPGSASPALCGARATTRRRWARRGPSKAERSPRPTWS